MEFTGLRALSINCAMKVLAKPTKPALSPRRVSCSLGRRRSSNCRYISETVTALYFLPSCSTVTWSVWPFLIALRFFSPTNFVFEVT